LTYARTWALSPCLGSTSFTCNAMVGLVAFEVGIFKIRVPKRMV
jgi:vacuolar-type H+-ATPase subunit I/STV1